MYIVSFLQMKEVKLSNDELKQHLTRSLKSVEKLSAERATMTKQLEQQALWVWWCITCMYMYMYVIADKSYGALPTFIIHVSLSFCQNNHYTHIKDGQTWSWARECQITAAAALHPPDAHGQRRRRNSKVWPKGSADLGRCGPEAVVRRVH